MRSLKFPLTRGSVFITVCIDVNILELNFSHSNLRVQEKHAASAEKEETDPLLPTDPLFIWRMVMMALSCLAAVVGVVVVGADYGMHPVKPVMIKKTI